METERALRALPSIRRALLSRRDPELFQAWGRACLRAADRVFDGRSSEAGALRVHRAYGALGTALLELGRGPCRPDDHRAALQAHREALRALGAWRAARARRSG